MKSIQTQVTITGIRSKVDRSLSLTMTTPELEVAEKAIILELQSLNCEMTLTPMDVDNVEEYKIEKDLDQKPQSVRMRNTLFILFKQDPEGHQDFNTYYRAKMESLIEWLKRKIED